MSDEFRSLIFDPEHYESDAAVLYAVEAERTRLLTEILTLTRYGLCNQADGIYYEPRPEGHFIELDDVLTLLNKEDTND